MRDIIQCHERSPTPTPTSSVNMNFNYIWPASRLRRKQTTHVARYPGRFGASLAGVPPLSRRTGRFVDTTST